MNFTSANNARYFFNSGGSITLTSTLSGGTATQQYNKWVLLLDSVTYTWGGSSFYTLTSTPAQVYLSAASSPYTGNYIKISVSTPGVANNSTGTAGSVQLLIEYIDGYTDPPTGGGRLPSEFPPGDSVDGNLSVFATTKEAYGFLVPAGAGNFTVQSPTVSYGAFSADSAPTPPTPTYSLTPSVSSVNEGQSFTITFATNQSGSFAYTTSGVSALDMGTPPSSSTVINGDVLTFATRFDFTTEGPETFTISLTNGLASASVTINDTSVA